MPAGTLCITLSFPFFCGRVGFVIVALSVPVRTRRSLVQPVGSSLAVALLHNEEWAGYQDNLLSDKGWRMIRKTMFGFKLERTDETLMAHGGLALLTGFNHEPGLCALVDRYLLGASSNRAVSPRCLRAG